ncbi:MAG: MATE family efflux transporter [Bacteroidales bacterium]|nr:MATE family efflux transporter [Bacteroidales bacterium]
MKTSISTKEIWRIAVPIMIGNLAQTLITFTDTAFLGHLGVVALGSSMMAGMYYFVFTTMAMGLAIGIQIIIARRFGAKEYNKIGSIFQHGAASILIFGLLLFAIMRIFSGSLLDFIIESDGIYTGAMEYIGFRQFGIVFVCFNYLFRSLYTGLSNTKVITFSTVIMAAVNIILDYCLIFGKFGFPEMGIGGAALASLIAEVTATTFFLVYTYIKLGKSEYELFKPHGYDKELAGNIVRIATPTMFQKLFSFTTWFIFFILVEKMGEEAIGISSIARSVYMILFIPVFGFLATSNTLTSRIIGAGHADEVMATLFKIIFNCILCCIPLILICVFFPTAVMSIYTDDMTLANAAIPSIFVICGAIIFQALGAVSFEAVSGTGKTNAALWLEFGILLLYIAYIWMLTNITTHVEWVWTCEYIYGGLLAIVSILYIKYANWHKLKI